MKASQIAINTISTAHPNLEEVLQAYSDAGFQNVEWCIPHAKAWMNAGHSLDDLANLLDRLGLRSIGGFEAGIVAFASPDDKKKNFQLLIDNSKLLGQLGGGVMVVGTDGPSNAAATVESLDVIGKTMAELVEKMDPSVALAVEFNWSPIVKSIPAAKRVVDAADHKRVGILFDPAHYKCTPSKLEHLTKKVIKKILHVHVDDMNDKPAELSNCNSDRELPLEGTLNLVELLRTIKKGGYKGLYSIEMFNEQLWKQPVNIAAKACYKSMKKLSRQLGK